MAVSVFFAVPVANSFAQISLPAQQMTIEQLSNEVAAQSDYKFFYSDRMSEMKINVPEIKNKGIEEHHLFTAIDLGAAAHIPNFKLYLMVGLPFEEDADIDAIIDLTERLRDYMDEKGSRGTLTLSINPFVPKPFTPFQWMPMADKKRLDAVMKELSCCR